jgi:ABC-type branched-subunit amino acid transport system substrate-binding protein
MEDKKKGFNWSKWSFFVGLLALVPYSFIVILVHKTSNYLFSGILAILFIACLWWIHKLWKEQYKEWKFPVAIVLSGIFLTMCLFTLPCLQKKSKTRVAILLPFTGGKKPLIQDGEAQLTGIFRFIGTKGQKYNNDIEYVFIDHENKSDIARNVINEELEKGTRYFFSTMSSVNEKLANYFNTPKVASLKPILVCGVTSYPNINTKAHSVYRYYVRSQDEAPVLAGKAKEDNIKHVVAIIVEDNYGEGTLMEFEKHFKDKNEGATVVTIKYANDTEISHIENKIAENKKQGVFAKEELGILICHYGSGIDDIITSLAKQSILSSQKPILYVTSTLHSETWKAPILPVLDTIPHHIAVPKYKNSPPDKYIEDVKNFSEFAFEKMIQSIMAVKNGGKRTFEEAWTSTEIKEIPLELSEKESSKYLGNGDTEIKMTIE